MNLEWETLISLVPCLEWAAGIWHSGVRRLTQRAARAARPPGDRGHGSEAQAALGHQGRARQNSQGQGQACLGAQGTGRTPSDGTGPKLGWKPARAGPGTAVPADTAVAKLGTDRAEFKCRPRAQAGLQASGEAGQSH